jgi:periplasmic copper chaperone A
MRSRAIVVCHSTVEGDIMRVRFLVIAAISFVALQSFSARAEDVKAGDLVISQPWSRAPAGAKVASGYLTIENRGTAPDRLLGGTADVAAKVDVHEMGSANGVMTMRSLNDGLTLSPGATVKLAPGGYHLMLAGLMHPLKQGDNVSMTLKFEKAGNVAVTFNVMGVGAKGPDSAAKPAMAPMDKGDMTTDHGKMKM